MLQAYFFLFALSGFSGLIYESIWSHYLKLYLGHAAYAQSLVLAIFMGGMAIGSALASRWSMRWRNLLVGYALIEGLVGVFALGFHGTFTAVADLSFDRVIPALGDSSTIQIFKWGAASLLIFPQSVLLGMTFPLMSAGIIRRFPSRPGAAIAALYFVNSLGGALGVLVSSFGLIAWVGLPGTVLTAGIINVVLALVVWLISKGHSYPAPEVSANRKGAPGWLWTLLFAAFITGAASFIYEIGWIRMLSLVLGGSTHAFDLMLSAFILGLALGGMWIRRRMEGIENHARYTGYVQVLMGLFALATLVVYGNTFELMHFTLAALGATDEGYRAFHWGSHFIALVVMLPPTFFAGMTLPLMTYALVRRGHGEKSIGAVYAANTIGAIVGVVAAVHLLMPLIGLKGLVIVGAALDLGLGVLLLTLTRQRSPVPSFAVTGAVGFIALGAASLWIDLDPLQMASGVYRHGNPRLSADTELLSHRDGKTATIALTQSVDGVLTISTNGKPDASISVGGAAPVADEVTMVMAGALPLALHPQARRAANIGLGSGLTTHTLLASDQLERVDTIEIEEEMIKVARGFGEHVTRTYEDPRSQLFVEDAKTFFSTRHGSYDIIISEPSNPWVSGVSGLFSEEFYRRIRNYLAADGLLVQWLQIYEIDLELLASVMKALAPNFDDYAIYNTDNANMLVVARKSGDLGTPDWAIIENSSLAEELSRVGINSLDDIRARRIGGERLLGPLFSATAAPPNSDYFPYLDLNAARSRFMGSNALALVELGLGPLPVLEMLDTPDASWAGLGISPSPFFSRPDLHAEAERLHQALLEGQWDNLETAVPERAAWAALLARLVARDCPTEDTEELWLNSVFQLARALNPYLPADRLSPIWSFLNAADCSETLPPLSQAWLSLFQAVAARNAIAMGELAARMLDQHGPALVGDRRDYVLGAGLLGYLAQGSPSRARGLWAHFGVPGGRAEPLPIYLRLLVALTVAPQPA